MIGVNSVSLGCCKRCSTHAPKSKETPCCFYDNCYETIFKPTWESGQDEEAVRRVVGGPRSDGTNQHLSDSNLIYMYASLILVVYVYLQDVS